MAMTLAAVMATLSVAVPMLERAELVPEPVAESEHSPGTCPPAHDHLICTQVTSQLLAASTDAPVRDLPILVAPASITEAGLGSGLPHHREYASRAPPHD